MPELKGPIREILILAAIAVALFVLFRVVLPRAMGVDSPITVVHGPSMEPTYEDGDILLVKHVDPASLKVGDVIVFLNPNIPQCRTDPDFSPRCRIVHRIVGIETEWGELYFVTQGDNPVTNPRPDVGRVSPELILGVPVLHIPVPQLGHLLLFLQRPLVRVAIAAALVLLLVWDFFASAESSEEGEAVESAEEGDSDRSPGGDRPLGPGSETSAA